jgi:predicted metalloprotease with PDZ domain
MRVKVTKSMTGAHGLTIETTGIGNVVTAVKEASPGAKAGIVSGMRILAINDIDMARATKKDCLVQIKKAKVFEMVLEVGIRAPINK